MYIIGSFIILVIITYIYAFYEYQKDFETIRKSIQVGNHYVFKSGVRSYTFYIKEIRPDDTYICVRKYLYIPHHIFEGQELKLPIDSLVNSIMANEVYKLDDNKIEL